VADAPSDFAMRLESVRMTQMEFRRLVQRLGGGEIDPSTTSLWVSGKRTPHACALALLEVIARMPPAQLSAMLKDLPPVP